MLDSQILGMDLELEWTYRPRPGLGPHFLSQKPDETKIELNLGIAHGLIVNFGRPTGSGKIM